MTAHEKLPGRALSWALIFVTALTFFVAIPPASLGQPLRDPLKDPTTVLKDYVNARDNHYGFEVVEVNSGLLLSQYTVRMKSQEWNPGGEIINRTVWEHGMAILVPHITLTDTGLLVIAGGDNKGELIGDNEVRLATLVAQLTGSVVTVLFQVPNQPLIFADDPALPLKEDALVAYTWRKTMDKAVMGTPDYSWPAYLPMVKSAVRAMDTVQELVPSVKKFVVTGFSKRGATTWLTAGVDPRVKAIAPGVFDALNFSPQVKHHLSVYGCFAPAHEDYVNYEIYQRLDTPEGQVLRLDTSEGQALRQVVDPYSYRDLLILPKFLLSSSGDQFFVPDAARFYWDDLLGEKHLRYIPNSGHSLSHSSTVITNTLVDFLGWYRTVLFDTLRPKVSWSLDKTLDETGALVVTTSPPAPFAQLWQATNPDARDFRLESIGEAWTSSTLSSPGDGVYVARVPPPDKGWTAYFVELIYPGGIPQVYSTQVFVTPDVLPFRDVSEVTVCPE